MGEQKAGLKKLSFSSYTDEGFKKKKGFLSVLINPDEYTHNYAINYTTNNPVPGCSGQVLNFEKLEAETLTFKLIYDATGALGSSNPCDDVTKAVDNLKQLIYNYNGEIHSPNYIAISWGTMLFKCRLTAMEVKYTLFLPNGNPLRVKVNLTFKGFLDPVTSALKERNQSADLTHIKVFGAGDTLPLLCNLVYGDSKYYIQVAKHNSILNFRSIEPGDRLVFPPLSK